MDHQAAVHVPQEAELLPAKTNWPREILWPSESPGATAAFISSYQREI